LHTVAVAEDTLTELATTETLVQWVKVQEIKTAEVQAVAEELVETGSTVQLAVAVAQEALDKME
jgi:hypothetical protein